MRGISRRTRTTSNSIRPDTITAANENSSTDSRRSQSWCAAGGTGGRKTARTNSDARYAPQKKIPALTRPRSVGGTIKRSRNRTVSSAIAMTGSDPCADHSCAKREGKQSTLSWLAPTELAPTHGAPGARDGGLRGDAEAVVARRSGQDRQGVTANDAIERFLLALWWRDKPDQLMPAVRAADEEAEAALLREGVADDAIEGARWGRLAGEDQVAEVDARARRNGSGVVAPVASRASAGQGPVQKQGATTWRPAASSLIAHGQQLARRLAQRGLDQDQDVPPGPSSASDQARTRRARSVDALVGRAIDEELVQEVRRDDQVEAPADRGQLDRQVRAAPRRAPATRSTPTTLEAAPKRARSARRPRPSPRPRSRARAGGATSPAHAHRRPRRGCAPAPPRCAARCRGRTRLAARDRPGTAYRPAPARPPARRESPSRATARLGRGPTARLGRGQPD